MAAVKLKINGRELTLDEEHPVTLLEAIRSRCGITSPKDGCSPQGVCGCCTVMLNGKPQMACRKKLDECDGAGHCRGTPDSGLCSGGQVCQPDCFPSTGCGDPPADLLVGCPATVGLPADASCLVSLDGLEG